MKITLKDGSVKEYDSPKSVMEIAGDISAGLARNCLAGEVNGERVDFRTVISEDCTLNILTDKDEGGLATIRHTASHVLAQALKRLYPKIQLAIGPSTKDGFYSDVDSEEILTTEDFDKIEAEMKKIIKEDLKLERFELPRDEAIKFFEEKNEPYKVKLIEDLPEDAAISLYKQGEFTDLCAGPHIMSTKGVKAFKIMKLAGAYWRGDSKNKMLTRIYGTAFAKQSDLDAYLFMLEEAKKRDHRKIGKEMKLFMFSEEGPGFPFFLPNGMVLRNELMKYWREVHYRNGYVEIETPVMLNQHLWVTSGHWDHYQNNMYTAQVASGEDDQLFCIKPMNCPGSILVYKNQPRSYKELPLRFAEVGLVHRYEESGALHGLMRVRAFHQDDAHEFLAMDQIEDEVAHIVHVINEVYEKLEFKYHVELSTMPEDHMGSDEDWEKATNGLRQALEKLGLEYEVNEGDGAFYGPKIDFHVEDCLGRTWQCATCQLDFQLPQNFELSYIGADGEEHMPVMIHRVVFGSVERFIGVMIENFAGKFPTWLSPVQARVLPISDKFLDYAKEVEARLKAAGVRAEVDERSEKIGFKIREARLERIPYMLVVGAKEAETGAVSVRSRFEGDEGAKKLDDFIADITKEIADRVRREDKVQDEEKPSGK
ncbi:MAG: threonine--tRNA ligase [Lachnospiraceae bacterium]|nr:threonine--tRNA ligase [Lachnospiraceae bacterium]